jgi:hypothetical protein
LRITLYYESVHYRKKFWKERLLFPSSACMKKQTEMSFNT